MNRRGFLTRVAAFVPALGFLSRAARFKSMVRVTVNHDDAQPVEFTVVGWISTSGPPVEYVPAAPFRGKTPLAFTSFPAAKPTIIQAVGTSKLRVVADNELTRQHLIAKAPRVTIRMHKTPSQVTVTEPLIEIVGEPASNP